MPRRAPFPEAEARRAIDTSLCWRDALRKLGYRPAGHNPRTLQKYAALWGISTDHFDPHIGRRRAARKRVPPLEEVLTKHSSYPRGRLKERLFNEGLKDRRCEICGQDEIWQEHRMSLIIDHINGVGDDHRLENLRIVCPNCAATLDTHCARNLPLQRTCVGCGDEFAPKHIRHRYCSLECWGVIRRSKDYSGPGAMRGVPRPKTRKVERPPYEQLLEEIAATNYSAVARKYGVSHTAIHKWVKWYERQAERERETSLA